MNFSTKCINKFDSGRTLLKSAGRLRSWQDILLREYLNMALRTVLVVKAVPKYVTLNKALDFKITTLL